MPISVNHSLSLSLKVTPLKFSAAPMAAGADGRDSPTGLQDEDPDEIADDEPGTGKQGGPDA